MQHDFRGEIDSSDFAFFARYSPSALAIRESVRLAALRRRSLVEPVLDVGCGDGVFARQAFRGLEAWGLDIDPELGRLAISATAYTQVILADVTRSVLPERYFRTCVANCSLEHIPDIDAALRAILRSLRPGGTAYIIVPQKDWTHHLLSVRGLRRAALPRLAQFLARAIDDVFRHVHLHDVETWRGIVGRAGFSIEVVEPIGSTASSVAFEAFLLPSLLGWANKRATTRWTNFPALRALAADGFVAALQAALSIDRDPTPTAEWLIVARRPEESLVGPTAEPDRVAGPHRRG